MTTTSDAEEQREALAIYAHDCWSRWMTHLFSRAIQNADGSSTISADDVQRWHRQRNAPYAQLTPAEQSSDRKEADRISETLSQAGFMIQRNEEQERLDGLQI